MHRTDGHLYEHTLPNILYKMSFMCEFCPKVHIIKGLLFEQFFSIDVDKCGVINGGCEHLCTNTIESYRCTCRSGFVLNKNGKTCSGKSYLLNIYKEMRIKCNEKMAQNVIFFYL